MAVAGLAVASGAAMWILAGPAMMSTSSLVALTALLVAIAAVTLISARNGSPTGSVGQLLYETEHPVRADVKRRSTGSTTW